MLAHRWFRLAIGFLGLLIWLAIYLLVRFGRRDMRWTKTPLLVLGTLCGLVWIGFEASDKMRAANLFQGNFFGLLCAHYWLNSHYKVKHGKQVTTLGLSDGESAHDVTRTENKE
jgi:hypothetical protein